VSLRTGGTTAIGASIGRGAVRRILYTLGREPRWHTLRFLLALAPMAYLNVLGSRCRCLHLARAQGFSSACSHPLHASNSGTFLSI